MVVVPTITCGGGMGPGDADAHRALAGENLRVAAAKGDITQVQVLLQEGVPVNLTDEHGYTALQRAASEGHLDIVRLLIKQKSNVDHQDDQHGNTALHEAAWKGYSQTAEAMVRAKANVYIKNKGGFAPLHLSCQNSHNQTSRILLLAGCNPDIKNNYGDTPLHTAARYGHAGVSRILISAKANVNELNKNHDTALHIAVAMNRKKLTKILLESVTDQTIRNKQNEKPEDIAIRKGFDQILDTLRNPPPPVIIIEEKPPPPKKRETKEVTFKDFVDEGKGGKGDRKGDKKREKTNGSGTSSKDSSTRTKDKKKQKYEHKEKHKGRQVSWSPYGCQYYPPMTDQELAAPKLDSLPSDPLNAGEQYYIDLAGNIRKGPLGQSCHCPPSMKDVDTKLGKAKFALNDRISAANGKIDERICELERQAKSHLHHLNDSVTQLSKGKDDRMRRSEVSISSQKVEEIGRRVDHLRQWAEHQLATSSPFLYNHFPRPYNFTGPAWRTRDPTSGFLPLTRSWSEEAVSEYKDDCESGRFSSYKGLKVFDHPTSMYNITKSIHEEPESSMYNAFRPIPSLVPGSLRCPSPDGCQSRITDDAWRSTPISKRKESWSHSLEPNEFLEEPYGPFKYDKSVKLLAMFPPKEVVKECTDSGASASEQGSRESRSLNTSSTLGSSVTRTKQTVPSAHTPPSKLITQVPVTAQVHSPGYRRETSKVRVETGAIPKTNSPCDMTLNESDSMKHRSSHQDKKSTYSPYDFHNPNASVVKRVRTPSEYSYSKVHYEVNRKYNVSPEKVNSERIYESYSRPGGRETELEEDLDRQKMQQVARRLYDGYIAKGHLDPVRRTGRPPVSPFKDKDSQNDSGYSARLSSSSSQEPSPSFSG